MPLSMRVRVHYVDEDEEAKKPSSLSDNSSTTFWQALGFSKDNLPSRLGGKADFDEWVRKRLQTEREKDATSNDLKQGVQQETNQKEREREIWKVQAQIRESNKRRAVQRDHAHAVKRRKTLQDQGDFLEEQLVVAQHLTRQYDNDKEYVHACLTKVLGEIPDVAGQATTESARADLACELLRTSVQFMGRNILSGVFHFEIPSHLNENQKLLASVLVERLNQCIEAGNRRGIAGGRHYENPQAHFECNHNADTERDSEQHTISILTETQHSLLAQQRQLEQEEQFLKASLSCADYIARQYNSFRGDHSNDITTVYKAAVSLTAKVPPSWLQGPFSVSEVAESFLAKNAQWEACSFISASTLEMFLNWNHIFFRNL